MITIDKARNWESYRNHWTELIASVQWYDSDVLMHYSPEEELEELENVFINKEGIFLLAKDEMAEIRGLLGVRCKGNVAKVRPWEPLVAADTSLHYVGQVLLGAARTELRRKGIKTLLATLKYSIDEIDSARQLRELYLSCDFNLTRYVGIQLIADLTQLDTAHRGPQDTIIRNIETIDVDRVTEYVLRAYMSSPGDRSIHGNDPGVSTAEGIMRALNQVTSGSLGTMKPGLYKQAFKDGALAGFILAVIPDRPYYPRHGLICLFGVFPEFRRQGIGQALLYELGKTLKEYSCEYTFVGTPKENQPAINCYIDAGFEPNSWVEFYSAELNP